MSLEYRPTLYYVTEPTIPYSVYYVSKSHDLSQDVTINTFTYKRGGLALSCKKLEASLLKCFSIAWEGIIYGLFIFRPRVRHCSARCLLLRDISVSFISIDKPFFYHLLGKNCVAVFFFMFCLELVIFIGTTSRCIHFLEMVCKGHFRYFKFPTYRPLSCFSSQRTFIYFHLKCKNIMYCL